MSVRVRVVSAADVARHLDPDALVDALAATFADLSAGRASTPDRIGVDVPGRGVALVMGAHRHGGETVTAKVVTVFPGGGAGVPDDPRAAAHGGSDAAGGGAAPLDPGAAALGGSDAAGGGAPPTHHAVVLVLDAASGAPLMVADGAAITALRTAAASRLATRLLARDGARVLGVLGSGVQAAAHVRALVRDHAYDEVRIAARRPEAARALADALARETGQRVVAVDSAAAALAGADVVCATTAATEPVVRRELLADGAHVNSVGFSTHGREVDAATVRDALVVVESRAAALRAPPVGCGDLAWPIRDGVVTAAHVHAELGELVAGTRPGRSDPTQLTLYKSVGIGLEDDAAAALLWSAVVDAGAGTVAEL